MADLFNREAEQYVVGAMLLHPNCIEEVAGIVSPEQFTDSVFRDLFYIIQSCVARSLAVDVVSLSAVRERLSNGDYTIACAADLLREQGGYSNVVAYANVVADKARLRACQRAIIELGNKIKNDAISPDDFVALAQSELNKLAGSDKAQDVCFVGDRLHELRDALMARVEAGGKISGLLTGYHEIDKIFEGMRGNMMIVIAGRPGSGKTLLAVNILENLALQGTPSLIFSLEMSNLQLSTRMLSSLGKIPLSNLNRGDIADHGAGLTIGIDRMKKLPIVICERDGMTIEQIRAIARFQRRVNKVEIIVLDYLSLVRTVHTKNSTRTLELGEISRQCKAMSKELNIPVIVLAQLNREIDKGGDRDPRMSDLRDSGEIEQDADIIAFTRMNKEEGITRLIIEKHRYAATGCCTLLNRLDISRLESMPSGYTQPVEQNKKSVDRYMP